MENIFLLPKVKGGYRGIGIVVLLCKVCSVVVNFCLKRSSMLHDAFHGFKERWWESRKSLSSRSS